MVKVLYIAGLGRNGGTLLDRIMGEYDGFFSLGEFWFVWLKGLVRNEICNCGQPFRDCDFWTEVFDRAFGGMEGVDAEEVVKLALSVDVTRYVPALLSPIRTKAYEERVARYMSLLGRLYSATADVAEARVLVDSSKFAGYALCLASTPNLDVRVLHLVRDSRAVAYSWAKKKRKPEVTEGDSYLKRFGAWESSSRWFYSNIAAQLTRKRIPHYRLLRYQDFVSHPEEEASRIVNWLGEDVSGSPFINGNTVMLGDSHTQSGNPMRFHQGELKIRLDDEWTAKMTSSRKTLVTCLTYPLLKSYGMI